MSNRSSRAFGAACVALVCIAGAPVWSQALSSLTAYGAQDVHVNAIRLDDARRAALIAFVQADTSMEPETRRSVLVALRQTDVPVSVVEHVEARMTQP